MLCIHYCTCVCTCVYVCVCVYMRACVCVCVCVHVLVHVCVYAYHVWFEPAFVPHPQEIRPYETKTLARLNFHAPIPVNHTAFIRIRTNHTSDPSLVLPVEVEVCEGEVCVCVCVSVCLCVCVSVCVCACLHIHTLLVITWWHVFHHTAVGLFLSRELLDFGVLKGGGTDPHTCSSYNLLQFLYLYSAESKSLPLYMLNAGPHQVQLKVTLYMYDVQQLFYCFVFLVVHYSSTR